MSKLEWVKVTPELHNSKPSSGKRYAILRISTGWCAFNYVEPSDKNTPRWQVETTTFSDAVICCQTHHDS